MRDKKENYDIYNTVECDNWSTRNALIADEYYLLSKHVFPLDKSVRILDVGTGNGRFLLDFAKRGFQDLSGIDMSDNLLSHARELLGKYPVAKLYKMNASDLVFDSNSFDVVLGLQQLISFISDKGSRSKALLEFHRVLKPGGLILASFLHYGGRRHNPLISLISLVPKIYKVDFGYLNPQYLPWLMVGHKINYRYIYKKQPYLYWFTLPELRKLFHDVGFNLLEIKTSKMIADKCDNYSTGGMIYFAARKKAETASPS